MGMGTKMIGKRGRTVGDVTLKMDASGMHKTILAYS